MSYDDDRLEMKAAAAEQSQETHNDQINRHDIVQQSRDDKDQNAGDQGHNRSDCQMEIHWRLTTGSYGADAVSPSVGTRQRDTMLGARGNVICTAAHIGEVPKYAEVGCRGIRGFGEAVCASLSPAGRAVRIVERCQGICQRPIGDSSRGSQK
jgi:hypothetical protein